MEILNYRLFGGFLNVKVTRESENERVEELRQLVAAQDFCEVLRGHPKGIPKLLRFFTNSYLDYSDRVSAVLGRTCEVNGFRLRFLERHLNGQTDKVSTIWERYLNTKANDKPKIVELSPLHPLRP